VTDHSGVDIPQLFCSFSAKGFPASCDWRQNLVLWWHGAALESGQRGIWPKYGKYVGYFLGYPLSSFYVLPSPTFGPCLSVH